MYIEFFTFKSKAFISVFSNSRIIQRKIGIIQTHTNNFSKTIHYKYHCEYKDQYILPCKTHPNGMLEWYKNDRRHRDEKENNLTLPAVIFDQFYGKKEW